MEVRSVVAVVAVFIVVVVKRRSLRMGMGPDTDFITVWRGLLADRFKLLGDRPSCIAGRGSVAVVMHEEGRSQRSGVRKNSRLAEFRLLDPRVGGFHRNDMLNSRIFSVRLAGICVLCHHDFRIFLPSHSLDDWERVWARFLACIASWIWHFHQSLQHR